MRAELDEYRDCLLGRTEPPIDAGVLTMMEVANAYYARAKEMEQLLLRAETEGVVVKNTPWYRFRTGELRSFAEMAKSCIDLGSRRLTAMKLELEMRG